MSVLFTSVNQARSYIQTFDGSLLEGMQLYIYIAHYLTLRRYTWSHGEHPHFVFQSWDMALMLTPFLAGKAAW